MTEDERRRLPQREYIHPLLKMAAISGVDSAVRLHIKRGADVNATDERGRSALMLAAQRGHARTCRLLLEAGADDALTDADGLDALRHAQARLHADVVLALLEHRSRQCTPTIQTATISHYPLVPPREDDATPDSSPWEAELEPIAPQADPQLIETSAAIQVALSTYKVLDRDATWDDIDIRLPERQSKSGAPTDLDDDLVESWRALIATGLRVGALPLRTVLLAADQDAIPFEEAEWLLQETLTEFGVAIEEFEPWMDDLLIRPPLDTDDEEEDLRIDEAVDHLLSLRRDRDRVYWSCLASTPPLDRHHRDDAGRSAEIEAGIADVIEALSRSPALRAALLVSIGEAIAGGCSLRDEPEQDDVTEEERDSAAARATALLCELAGASGVAGPARHGPTSLYHEVSELGSARAPVRRLANALRRRESLDAEARSFVAGADRWHAAWCGMVLANLRLAVHLVQKSWKNGVHTTDLIQEANTGLMRAAEKFDIRRGTRFATYAAWWVRARVHRHASCATLIRTPGYAAEIRAKAARARARFEAAGIEFTTADIAAELSCDPATLERVAAQARDPLPLPCVGDDDELEAIGADEQTPEDLVANAELRQLVSRHLDALAPRMALILRLRFGFVDGDDHTFSDVGERLGLSRERIRQIERAALNQLRGQEGIAELVQRNTAEAPHGE